jgi:hypothetical protein
LVVGLCLLPLEILAGQTRSVTQSDSFRQQLTELQTTGSEVEVRLLNGTKVHGRVLSVAATSFTFRTSAGQEWTWPFTDVVSVKKKGMSWGVKAAIIGGAALAVLCFAPFPVGLLCQKDPS